MRKQSATARQAMPPWLQDIYDGLPALLTIEECAETMRLAPETVRRYCRAGTLRAVQNKTGRGGSPLLVPRAVVIEWLRARELHQL